MDGAARNKVKDPAAFWAHKTLDELSPDEWEALCDGCARCCLVKLEDEDTAEIHLTRLACALLDISRCRCSDYANRHARMADCITLTPAKVRSLAWLPPTCAYRLVDEGRPLPWWHPLISGNPDTVHEAGISVRRLARSELGVRAERLQRYIIAPFEVPSGTATMVPDALNTDKD